MFDISNRRNISFYFASKMANYFRSVGRDESQFRIAVRLAVPGKVISHIAVAIIVSGPWPVCQDWVGDAAESSFIRFLWLAFL